MSKDFDNKVLEFFKKYQDRGMMKWQGMMLSDHTAALNKERQRSKIEYKKKITQDIATISEILMDGYLNHKQVSVQLNELTLQGNYLPDVVGFVDGYDGDQFFLSGQLINLDDVNHIEILD